MLVADAARCHADPVAPRSSAARRARSSTWSRTITRVAVTPVKLGPVQGEVTAIASGLAPGAIWSSSTARDKLREGAKVELITRDAQRRPRRAADAAAGAATGRGGAAGRRGRVAAEQPHAAGAAASAHPAGSTLSRARAMNPSRLFILRPVATTLLMVAILLAGIVAYRVLPLSALPEVDYPTIQVVTLYPGASPDVMTSSVTAPLERQFGQMPGLNQMSSTSSGGASVITLQFSLELVARRRRAGGAGGDQRVGSFLPTDLPNPADLQQGQSGRHADHHAGADVADVAAAQARGPRPTRGSRRRSRSCRAWASVSISGGQRPAVRIQVNPKALAAYGLSLDDVRTAIGNANTNQAEGQLRRADARVDHRRQRPVEVGRRIPAADHRVQERRAGARAGRRRQRSTRPRTRASPRGPTRRPRSSSTSSASPAPTSSRSSTASKQLLPQLQAVAAGRGRRRAAHRPHGDHPRVGAATCSSSCCSPWRWW